MQKSYVKRKVKRGLSQRPKPGKESLIKLKPVFDSERYIPIGKLKGKVSIITGAAPGPIWTPLIPATFPPKDVSSFGTDVPMGRAGQPYKIAPCCVFPASDDSAYITGQFLHPDGGKIING